MLIMTIKINMLSSKKLRYYLYKKDFDSLNSVIKRFLRYAAFKMGEPIRVNDHNYSDISKECKIFNLESIHRLNDLNFVLDNLHQRINTPNFNELFKKRSEIYNLREQRPLSEELHRRNYIHHAPLHRLARSWNSIDRELREKIMNENTSDKVTLKNKILEHF